ncbi:MAG: hypothetical protein ABI689_15970 [Thermoanaerobaculia bacterium]
MEEMGTVGSRLSGLALLASIVLLASSCREAPTAISMGGFAIDPHPEVRFLSIEMHPGLVKFTTTYNFFGDGRVQIDRFHTSGAGGSLESHTVRLTKEEQWRLMVDFLEGGLFTLDPKELQARDLVEGRARPSVADAGSFAVSIALVQRRWGGLGPRKVVRHRFAMGGSALALPFVSAAPDTREHEALRRLMELVRRVQARAAESETPS